MARAVKTLAASVIMNRAHEQAAHLPRVVGQADQAAEGDQAWGSRTSPTSSPGRPRSTRGGPPSTSSSSFPRRSISPRSCSPRTTGRRPMRPSPARRRRATTWCSRPGCSAARSASRRTFILHANGSKLPSDLLGLTAVRYDPATSPAEVRAINQKPQGDRDRGSPRTGRGVVVAALAYHEDRRRPVGGGPPTHLAGPRRWPQHDRPGLARGRHAIGPLLERGCEGAQGSGRRLLLLEGRAPSAPECPADLMAAARSRWRPPTARPGTGRHGPIATPG